MACRLFVSLLHPTDRVQVFGNTSALRNSPGTRTLRIKYLEKNLNGVLGDEKIGVFRPLSRCFISKAAQNTAIVTTEDK